LAIILIVLAAIFVVQNTVRHEIHLLWVTVEAATWLVLIVIFFIGVLTGVLLGRRRRTSQVRRPPADRPTYDR
jgi:uncharacterized integral membrane protein